MSRLPISSVSPSTEITVSRLTTVAKWLGRQSYLDDLQSLDKELYKGLISASYWFTRQSLTPVLKNYAKPEELALNFTITEEGGYHRCTR